MLELIRVSYQIGDKKLLDDISLSLQPGEVLSVMGKNGAGKSTLMKVLSGEYLPHTGLVRLGEKQLAEIPIRLRARVRAVLPQSSSLNFPFKVQQVVMMGRSPHRGEGVKKDQQIVELALEMTDTQHLKERIFTTLSGGERQRVHLARVLAQIWPVNGDNKSRFLLLDEPTSALDLAHQHKTLMTAKKFAAEFNIGVLAVLHDLNLAAYYSDRIAVLKDGKMLCQGKPQLVLNPDNIFNAFGIPVKVIDHPVDNGCPLIVSPAQTINLQTEVC